MRGRRSRYGNRGATRETICSSPQTLVFIASRCLIGEFRRLSEFAHLYHDPRGSPLAFFNYLPVPAFGGATARGPGSPS
jgi:hypothetical protein